MIYDVLRLDEPTEETGRIYSKNEMQKAIETYINDYVNQKRAFIEFGESNTIGVMLDKVSHLINDIYIDENKVLVDIEILDTPMGEVCSELIDNNITLKVKPVMTGILDKDNKVSDITLLKMYIDKQ